MMLYEKFASFEWGLTSKELIKIDQVWAVVLNNRIDKNSTFLVRSIFRMSWRFAPILWIF